MPAGTPRASIHRTPSAARRWSRAAYRGSWLWNSDADWLARSTITPKTATSTSTVAAIAADAGSPRSWSQTMIGRLRTARKRAREKGSRIGAAMRRPKTTTTSMASTKRKRAPGSWSIRSKIMPACLSSLPSALRPGPVGPAPLSRRARPKSMGSPTFLP